MRFHLRTLFVGIALVAAFLGGRASVQPLIKEHQREKVVLEKQLKALVELRPAIGRIREHEAFLRDRLKDRFEDDYRRLEKDYWILREELVVMRADKQSRLDGRLAFPMDVERAMLGGHGQLVSPSS